MNKSLRNLWRMSPLFYNRSNMSVHTCLVHCIRNNHTADVDISKDADRLKELKPTMAADKLLYKLETYKNPQQIMQEIRSKYQLMTKKHAIAAFKSLYDIYEVDHDKNKIPRMNDLMQLFKVLTYNLSSVTPDEALLLLKMIMVFLDEEGYNFWIVQSLLNIIKNNVNNYSVNKLIHLHSMVIKMGSNNTANALALAVPIVFETRIRKELYDLTTHNLIQAMRFAISYCRSDATVVAILLSLQDKVPHLNVLQACHCYGPLRYLQNESQYVNLLCKIICSLEHIIINNMEKLKTVKICFMLRRIRHYEIQRRQLSNESKWKYTLYSDRLIDECLKSLIVRDTEIETTIEALNHLILLQHINFQFLDYAATKYSLCNIDLMPPEKAISMTRILLNAIANMDYKPIFWEKLKEKLINRHMQYIKGQSNTYSQLDSALSFAMLEHYDSELLESVFTTEHAGVFPEKKVILYQCVKNFYPEYTGPFFSDAGVEQCFTALESFTSCFKAPLEQGLGGSIYVRHNLRSKLGHVINHAVAMRKGGYPIAISNGNSEDENGSVCVESLQVPGESQIILIVTMPAHTYARNSYRLMGKWRLYLKSLIATTGCNVVAINLLQWQMLPDHEKIPYLMREIKLKCTDFLSNEHYV